LNRFNGTGFVELVQRSSLSRLNEPLSVNADRFLGGWCRAASAWGGVRVACRARFGVGLICYFSG